MSSLFGQADDIFFSRHPELVNPETGQRRSLTMTHRDSALRQEWMGIYRALERAENEGYGGCDVGGVIQRCPLDKENRPKEEGVFPSTDEGLQDFINWTDVGRSGTDTAYNPDNYNCQGFAGAMGYAAIEAGVATNSRMIHAVGSGGVDADGNRIETVNHAITEITLEDGSRYLIDAQTRTVSPAYTLDEDGEIPDDIRDGYILNLYQNNYDETTSSIRLPGSRALDNPWSEEQLVTDQSAGLNSDRERREDSFTPPDSTTPPVFDEELRRSGGM
ncbi:MAG: hypothetical protein HQK65_14160 [Desulfamplus sp.]|nr:hypothetical protein [Desulfamplus sp.]